MSSPFNRTVVFISLGLSLAMVVGVIFGAYWVYNHGDSSPVAIAPVKSDQAGSSECADVIANAPDKLLGRPRAEVAEPIPDGVAAWARASQDPVTLRCGVDLPYQFTEYTATTEIDGARWMQVRDMTPGSDLVTWYTTDRAPVVAVTAAGTSGDTTPHGLSDALSALRPHSPNPRPAPLSGLESGPSRMCAELDKQLPDQLAEGYRREDDPAEDTYLWRAPGREEIVVRCGVAPPENYRAGERLQQINDVPWFEDTTLAEGTTAGTWFALGRENDLAVHAPQDVADEVLVGLSNQLAQHTPAAG